MTTLPAFMILITAYVLGIWAVVQLIICIAREGFFPVEPDQESPYDWALEDTDKYSQNVCDLANYRDGRQNNI